MCTSEQQKGFMYAVYQCSSMFWQQGSAPRPEEELDRLTKKLVYDMNHPPTEEYFGMLQYLMHFFLFYVYSEGHGSLSLHLSLSGRCARCGDNVLGDGSGCIAMEQVFHVECFTCITCHARLRGQPFYALDRKSYCESCYIVSRFFVFVFFFLSSSLGFCRLLFGGVVAYFTSKRFTFYSSSLLSEHTWALFKMLWAHPRPDPEGDGKGLPSSLFHMCGLRLLSGWSAFYCGCHISDPLYWWLPQVLTHFSPFVVSLCGVKPLFLLINNQMQMEWHVVFFFTKSLLFFINMRPFQISYQLLYGFYL